MFSLVYVGFRQVDQVNRGSKFTPKCENVSELMTAPVCIPTPGYIR